MLLIAGILVAPALLYTAAGCTIPYTYYGVWGHGYTAWNFTTNKLINNRGTFVCTDIHDYADEPEAKTILFKDPNAFRGYIYCYYCLFVRKIYEGELERIQTYFRDTICSRHGDPSVNYACLTNKPSAYRLRFGTLTRNQESKKRGLWWV